MQTSRVTNRFEKHPCFCIILPASDSHVAKGQGDGCPTFCSETNFPWVVPLVGSRSGQFVNSPNTTSWFGSFSSQTGLVAFENNHWQTRVTLVAPSPPLQFLAFLGLEVVSTKPQVFDFWTDQKTERAQLPGRTCQSSARASQETMQHANEAGGEKTTTTRETSETREEYTCARHRMKGNKRTGSQFQGMSLYLPNS